MRAFRQEDPLTFINDISKKNKNIIVILEIEETYVNIYGELKGYVKIMKKVEGKPFVTTKLTIRLFVGKKQDVRNLSNFNNYCYYIIYEIKKSKI